MALFSHNYKSLYPIIFVLRQHYRHYVRKSNKDGNDLTIDDFTTRLIQQKSEKWDTLNINKKRLFDLVKSDKLRPKYNLVNENGNDLNNWAKQIIDNRNYDEVMKLVEYYKENKKIVVRNTLMGLISLCGHYGDKESVLALIEVGQEANVLNVNDCRYCQQYLAEAVWIRGNVQQALSIIKELYVNNSNLRKNISLLLRFLIGKTVELRTEAVFVQIKNLVLELSTKYNDYTPLCCLWQSCILSDWFSDQSTAIELLEQNVNLREHHLSKIYKVVITIALNQNKIDVVQRLLEVFLKNDMTSQYVPLLQQIFDYYYYQRDYRHCAEIIRWSIELDIPLRTEQNAKFVNLLLNQYGSGDTIKMMTSKPPPKKIVRAPQFKLKF